MFCLYGVMYELREMQGKPGNNNSERTEKPFVSTLFHFCDSWGKFRREESNSNTMLVIKGIL